MNHNLWISVGARFAALSFVVGGLAACDRNNDVTSRAADVSPSAQVIGVVPAPPTGDPPGTTPVASNTTEVTKQEANTQKPSEGDNHSYSSLAPNNPQKAGGTDPQQTPERKSAQ